MQLAEKTPNSIERLPSSSHYDSQKKPGNNWAYQRITFLDHNERYKVVSCLNFCFFIILLLFLCPSAPYSHIRRQAGKHVYTYTHTHACTMVFHSFPFCQVCCESYFSNASPNTHVFTYDLMIFFLNNTFSFIFTKTICIIRPSYSKASSKPSLISSLPPHCSG